MFFIKIESGVLKGTTNINLAKIYPPEGNVDDNNYAFPATTTLSEDKYFETVDERGIDSTILEKDVSAKQTELKKKAQKAAIKNR